MGRISHIFPLDEELDIAAVADIATNCGQDRRKFEALVKLTASLLDMTGAAIKLFSREGEPFFSRHAPGLPTSPHEEVLCGQVIAESRERLLREVQFANPSAAPPSILVPQTIRFFAGVPLLMNSGQCVGCLYLVDPKPQHQFSDSKFGFLRHIASLASEVIEARRYRSDLTISSALMTDTPGAVIATNTEGRVLYWNPAASEMFGLSAERAYRRPATEFVPGWIEWQPEQDEARADDASRFPPLGQLLEQEAVLADGTRIPVQIAYSRWTEGNRKGHACIMSDISARKRLENDHRAGKKFLDAIVQSLPSMLFVKNTETREYILVNREAENLIGRAADTMIGKSDAELFPGQGEAFELNDIESITGASTDHAECEFERDDGSRVHLRTKRVLIDGPDRADQYLLGLSEDVTEVRRLEEERSNLARFDALTGLWNRTSFLERVNQLLATGKPFAIMNLDLDRFKSVNDQFGHMVGDEVLKLIGERLREINDRRTMIARIGGDEFVCVLEGSDLRDRTRSAAERLAEDIRQPIDAGGIVTSVGVSIGVVLYPDDGDAIETLRRNADIAMYRAKQESTGEVCFFDAEMDAAERDRRLMERDLRLALENDEIDVAYQPIVHARTGAITSFEALARWTDPNRGPVSPEVFIRLAECTGLIEDLGKHVLRRACRDAMDWPEHIRVAVNLSPRQFYSGNLVTTVFNALEESALAPNRLQLEITESLVMQKAERAFEQLERLKAHGIQIAIDDFGIGYSSLSYFQSFRFDKVKIDKAFVCELDRSVAARAIVTAVVGLADRLSMMVVAEGVETQEQRQMLMDLGCTHLQGFLFSKPQSARDLPSLIEPQAA